MTDHRIQRTDRDQRFEFNAMFGLNSKPINFATEPPPKADILPLPQPEDSLTIMSQKMLALRQVVIRGESLAIHTGYIGTTRTERDPEKAAMIIMEPVELEQFKAWKNGAKIKPYDWKVCKKTIIGGAESKRRHEKRAVAMREIFHDETIDSENVAWIAANHPLLLPLIIAVVKVHNAHRDLTGGSSFINEIELAELQTIRKINSTFATKLNKTSAEFNRVVREGNMSRNTLEAREHAINNKNPAYRRRQDAPSVRRGYNHFTRIQELPDIERISSGDRCPRTDLRTNLVEGIGLASDPSTPTACDVVQCTPASNPNVRPPHSIPPIRSNSNSSVPALSYDNSSLPSSTSTATAGNDTTSRKRSHADILIPDTSPNQQKRVSDPLVQTEEEWRRLKPTLQIQSFLDRGLPSQVARVERQRRMKNIYAALKMVKKMVQEKGWDATFLPEPEEGEIEPDDDRVLEEFTR